MLRSCLSFWEKSLPRTTTCTNASCILKQSIEQSHFHSISLSMKFRKTLKHAGCRPARSWDSTSTYRHLSFKENYRWWIWRIIMMPCWEQPWIASFLLICRSQEYLHQCSHSACNPYPSSRCNKVLPVRIIAYEEEYPKNRHQAPIVRCFQRLPWAPVCGPPYLTILGTMRQPQCPPACKESGGECRKGTSKFNFWRPS